MKGRLFKKMTLLKDLTGLPREEVQYNAMKCNAMHGKVLLLCRSRPHLLMQEPHWNENWKDANANNTYYGRYMGSNKLNGLITD